MAALVTPNRTLGLSFLLYLAALPLISVGTTARLDPLWGCGLALLALAAALPPLTRVRTLLVARGRGRGEAS